ARRTSRFVGGASEQAILGQSLGLASTTGKPVLVTVVGEPGIGKSRLAEELAAGMSAAVPILRGESRTFADTATFSPIAAIVGDLAGINQDDPPETVGRRLRELVGVACGAGQPARGAAGMGLEQQQRGAGSARSPLARRIGPPRAPSGRRPDR